MLPLHFLNCKQSYHYVLTTVNGFIIMFLLMFVQHICKHFFQAGVVHKIEHSGLNMSFINLIPHNLPGTAQHMNDLLSA